MKFEIVDEKPPEEKPWEIIARELGKLAKGKDLFVSDVTSHQMSAIKIGLSKHTDLKVSASKERGGYRLIVTGHRKAPVAETKPPAPAAVTPPAPAPKRVVAKTPVRDRVLKCIKEEPGILHSKLGRRFSGKDSKEFNSVIAELIRDKIIVDTVVPWRGPLGMKTTYCLNHPAVTPTVEAPPVPVSVPAHEAAPAPAKTHHHHHSAKTISVVESVVAKKKEKENKFPTGNKCFATVKDDAVCGDSSDVTYKNVRLCRRHMRLLNSRGGIFVRVSETRKPILLKCK